MGDTGAKDMDGGMAKGDDGGEVGGESSNGWVSGGSPVESSQRSGLPMTTRASSALSTLNRSESEG